MSHASVIPLFFLLAFYAVADEPAAVLSSSGGPMRVPFACTEDDMQFAGMNCSEDHPCAIYLELTAVAANSGKIAVSGNLHTNSATLYSILLLSDDAGSSWKEPAPRVRGSALDQVQFFDTLHAWAAGETQYPLARDPFFFLTTDGGASWRQRAVSDDGSSGAIQTFSFDSPQHGNLVVDAGKTAPSGRYVTYESQTGGESWMIRSTTGQLPRARIPAPDPAWRVVTGKNAEAWQVEQKTASQWSSVASFLIEIANCK